MIRMKTVPRRIDNTGIIILRGRFITPSEIAAKNETKESFVRVKPILKKVIPRCFICCTSTGELKKPETSTYAWIVFHY